MASGQKNRYDFYESLADFLEESYWKAITAESAFDGIYLYYQELGALETEEEFFANRAILEGAENSLYENRREEFLNALAKYTFDLNCVFLIYNNTLTDSEAVFLNKIQRQVNSLRALFAQYDPTGSYIGAGETRYGYSAVKKIDRGMRVFGLYAEAVKMQVNYLHVDGGMAAVQDFTVYRVETMHVYSNRETS